MDRLSVWLDIRRRPRHKVIMIVLIDNYDSFTYNLVQYMGDLGQEVDVRRNDKTTVSDVINAKPSAIVISPGPCSPTEAGICLDLITTAAQKDIPMFGVCLGFQAMGQAFGGKIVRAPAPMHGKTSPIHHTGKSVFKDLPSPLTATRYHSLMLDRESVPDEFDVTAETDDGIVMGIAHKSKPIHGVLFHPESIATENGHNMLSSFLKLV